MTFCKIEQRPVLYAGEGVGLRLQMLKLHLKRVSAGQLVTRALLQACGAETLPGCKHWSLTMGQLSPESDVQLLGTGKIVLLNFTLISTIWCSLAHNVQARRYPDICLQLQIYSFVEADKLLLFVLWSEFANKAGLSEYSENNRQYCSFSETMFVSNGSFQSKRRLSQHHLRSGSGVSGEEGKIWSPAALSPTHFTEITKE